MAKVVASVLRVEGIGLCKYVYGSVVGLHDARLMGI